MTSNNDDTREEGVPFLIYDSNTRIFTLTEEGENVIKSIKGEFGVVSVAGMYRTGKSYLLNRMLLNRQKGFSVGPTVNPCTKGLWLWSKPIYGTSEKGKRIPILLIDTEGFGALDTDTNHDIRIFTVAILLSSFFAYNSIGSIDENALSNLNFVINLSKFIKLNNDSSNDEPEDLASIFPSFLWIVRDFTLQLIDDNGDQISAKDYLEKVLEGNRNKNDPKNKIRRLIKTYFKDRDCFTMIRPLTNEGQLQNLEDLPVEKLRPEFLEQILSLRKKILNRVKVKTLNGKPLNSDMYLNFIKNVINALNSGNVPNIENTWLSMCKVESYKALEEAENFYENFIKENMDGNEELSEVHREAKERALQIFNKKALGEYKDEYLRQLKGKIKEKYNYYSKIQDEENKGKIIRVLNKWYSILESRISNDEFNNINEINNDLLGLENKLNESFNFSGKNELFNEFKNRIFNYSSKYFSKKEEKEKKNILMKNEEKIKKLTNDLETIRHNYQKENDKKQIILKQNKTQINDLTDELNKIKETLKITEKEKQNNEIKYTKQIQKLKETFEKKIRDNENKFNLNEEKSKESERKVILIKSEFEKEKALLNLKNDQLQKQIEDFKNREKNNKKELNSIINSNKLEKDDLELKLKTNEDNFKIKFSKIERENAILKQENDLLKNQNEEIKNRLNEQKDYYEKIIQNLENKAFNVDHEEFQKKIDEIKEYYKFN